jgi:hypothetical protein
MKTTISDKLKSINLKFEVPKMSPAFGGIEERAFSANNYNKN